MELQYFIKQIFGDDEDRKFHLNYSVFIFLKNTHRPNKYTLRPFFYLNSGYQKWNNTMRFILYFLLLSNLTLSAQVVDFEKLSSLKIRNLGPANMSGRITCIDALKSNPKIIYVGAALGVFGNPKMEDLRGSLFLMNSLHKILAQLRFSKVTRK